MGLKMPEGCADYKPAVCDCDVGEAANPHCGDIQLFVLVNLTRYLFARTAKSLLQFAGQSDLT